MSKPKTLPVLFQNIPIGLRSVPRWTLWNYVLIGEGETQRWSKLPVQATGKAASSTNSTTWTDFLSAESAYLTGRFDGIGFVFTADDHIIGVDLDDCYDDATNQFTNIELAKIASGIKGYMEISPSGTGVKIFTLADLDGAHVDHDKGLEIYPKGRYFTVTGHKLSGELPTELQDITHLIPERTVRSSGDAFADYNPPLEGWDLARVEAELLPQFDPDCGYTDWLQMGMCLHHQFQGDLEACEMWDRWSYGDGSVVNYATNACENKWKTFNQKGGGATLRTLTFKISQNKRTEALAKGDLILGAAPMENAQVFLESKFSSEEGIKLVHYASDFFAYKGTHYADMEEGTVRSELYKFLDKCKKQDRKGNIVPFAPNPATVSGAMDAIKALVHLENHANTRPPVWLDGYGVNRPEANKLVSLKNGLFHLEDNILLPHSLGFYTQNSLPFAYDPLAECPIWLRFLNDVWPDDQESIDCLQEIFGYILSGDTFQQKFFNIIGPRRSGKGTINKVLVELLGQHNTVAPELGELCDTFGLQPWLGKLLASFTDARAPDRDRGSVVSQLLRIVGGDTVTINRKNKEAWNGYLPTRIVIYSNEVLQLTESSNALTGRMIVLKMSKSFYGKEDTALSTKLMGELSGIFNWAMVGLHRRLERGAYFVQPQTGKELLETMEEMSNPIGSFIEDVLEYDEFSDVEKDYVFICFKRWATKHGLNPGNDLSFKRRFLAATQDKGVASTATRIEGKRQHKYTGIKLNEKAQAYIDKQTLFDEEEIF
jgi:P4 family phage/plasmid primase-like protien